MAKVLETVQRLRKVEEATSQREEPAPVYLLDEIVELSKTSGENAQAICEHVVKRLTQKSPLVKFKALRLVKHMCLKGAPQFQRCMQRQSQAIRELVSFQGVPDPFKGDAPNAHVRELAKETIEVLFNATAASSAPYQGNQMQGRIQGFGSASSGPPPGQGPQGMTSYSSPSSASGSRMVGFGSNSYGNLGGGGGGAGGPSTAEQLTSAISPAVTNVIGGVSSMLKSATSSISRGSGQHSARMYDSPPRGNSPSPTPGPTHWGGASASGAAAYAAPAITAAQVMGSEEQLVDDICAPGGMRAAPLPEDLERFVSSVGSMDGLRVGELLRGKMEASSWQTVLRALCALQAVVDRGSSQACGEVAVMFQSDPTPLHAAVSHPQAPVREAAARVIKLLLNEDVAVAAAPPKRQVPKPYLPAGGARPLAAVAAPQQPQPDLLALDNSPTAAPQRPPAASPDLLGGLASSPTPTPPPAPVAAPAHEPDPLFAGLDTARGPPTPDAMFGGLTISSPSPGPPSQPPPHPAGPPPREPLDLLFADIPAEAAPHAAPQYAPPAPSTSAAPLNFLGTSPAPQLLGGAPAMDLLGMSLAGPPPPQPSASPAAAYAAAVPAPQPMPGYAPPQAGYAPPQAGYAPLEAGYGPPPQLGLGHAGWQAAPGAPGAVPGYPQPQLAGVPGGYATGAGGAAPLGGGMPGLAQQAVNAAAAAAALQNQMFGMQGPSALQQQGARPGGGAMRQGSWQGRDEVSNLMRHVATGGKHDPAFDFIKDELKPHK